MKFLQYHSYGTTTPHEDDPLSVTVELHNVEGTLMEPEIPYHTFMLQQDATNKEKAEAMLELFTEYSLAIRPNNKSMSERQVLILKALGRFTGYLIGCSSWRDNEIHDWDSLEFRKRLDQIKQLI